MQEINLIASPKEASNSEILKKIIAQNLGVKESEITSFNLQKRSIDARSRSIKINLRFTVFVNEIHVLND